jgi:hypothetical protein
MAAKEQNNSFLNIGGKLFSSKCPHIKTVGVFENLVTTIPIEYLNICSYFLLKPITVFIKKVTYD